MTSAEIKAEWIKLMAPIADGSATERMINAFSELTNDVYDNGHISTDEYMAAVDVALTAKGEKTTLSEERHARRAARETQRP